MKCFVILLITSSFTMAGDYEQSAREKELRYATFIRIMNMLEQDAENISPIAARRNFLVSNIYIKTSAELIRISEEENDENEWQLLQREDFETPIRASTPE